MKINKINRPKVAITPYHFKKEAQKTTKILKGKIVAKVWRHRPTEIGIQFTDGSRLFIDSHQEGLELSITDGTNSEE